MCARRRLGGSHLRPLDPPGFWKRSYHATNKKPKSLPDGAEPSAENMLDDETNEPLMQRKDDTKEALVERPLKGYHEMTTPFLDHYKAVVAAQARRGEGAPPRSARRSTDVDGACRAESQQ